VSEGEPWTAEALVAEDPRLTITQATHIAAALGHHGDDDDVEPEVVADSGDLAPERDIPVDHQPALEGLMRQILSQVVATVPGAVGAAIRLADGHGVTVGPTGLEPSVEVHFALESRIEGALGVVCAAGVTVGETDRRTLETIATFAATSIAAARSVTDTVGAVLGSGRAGSASSRLIASVLGPTLDRHVRLAIAAERVREVLGVITTHFQPIVELQRREVVGVEALTRFPPESDLTVDEWFRSAAEAGMSADLELAALDSAFRYAGRGRLPRERFLTINVSPSVAVTPAFLETVVDSIDPAQVVVEITEHAPVDDYRQLAGALRPLRSAGARLAIDDAGAGFASLRHVLRLSPDFIKLDLSLVHRIDADPVRRALATSLITFAGEVGATIVAEGIETRFELDTLVDLGVRYGQGFHLGRPGPLT
jgi:EAL domain-containing protein (putative c-di-GMP-specific phosphodiesterase class I)